jgi:NAD(P)H-hydrate epimerase
MRSIDARTIKGLGIPGLTLMENAGKGVVSVLRAVAGELRGKSFAIVCGKGNNGGDGFVAGRLLFEMGAHVKAYLLGSKTGTTPDAAVTLERYVSAGAPLVELSESNLFCELAPFLNKSHCVVDAIYGTGFKGATEGLAGRTIELINTAGVPAVSVDVPSGLDCDTGVASGPCVQARATAALALLKRGLVFFPGRDSAGDVYVVDIGIPADAVEQEKIEIELVDHDIAREWLPRRRRDAHKGDCGKVAVVGGSVGLTGAVALCCNAALRTGAGLVTAAVPASLNDILEVKLTEAMTRPVPETPARTLALAAKDQILELVASCDVLAFGPGLSRNKESTELARQIVPAAAKPTVLDADGLNAFAGHADLLARAGERLAITPHVVEMSRLTGEDPEEILNDRVTAAQALAGQQGVVVLLKGAPTVIAQPDGTTYVNPTGNAGLACGGSGDVLTGIVAALLGQGVPTVRAAALGAYLHGLAAEVAVELTGEEGMLPGDLVECLPEALIRAKSGKQAGFVRVVE